MPWRSARAERPNSQPGHTNRSGGCAFGLGQSLHNWAQGDVSLLIERIQPLILDDRKTHQPVWLREIRLDEQVWGVSGTMKGEDSNPVLEQQAIVRTSARPSLGEKRKDAIPLEPP
jgi:hypothetical protein